MTDYESLFERPTGPIQPQEVLRHGITESALDGETALFDVLPGVGKSRSVTKVAIGTGMPTTILTNLSDNYDQYKHWGEKDGIPVEKLPTRDLCPTLRDENPAYADDAIAQEAREARDLGWPTSRIHREFDIPCQSGQQCPYIEKIAEIDPGRQTPLVGHFTQAYNPAYIEGRLVIIDEACFNNYVHEIKRPVRKAEDFIDSLDEFPFEDVRRPEVGEEEKREVALEVLEKRGLNITDYSDSIGEFHAMAPLVAYAIYGADRMENRLHVAELPDDGTAVFDNLHKGIDDDGGSVWVLDTPDFSEAEAVIALDATPCVSNWRRVLNDDLHHYRLFDSSQRNQYLREQGYEFIQLNSHVWPVSGADVSLGKCEAYLREIFRKHGQRPDLITSKDMRAKLKKEGLRELWLDDLHYGDFRGKNDLADSELIVILGSPSRPDKHIQFQAAFHGDCAEPALDEAGERLNGYNLDYQSDFANDILKSTRRGDVFQAAMRAGRSEDAEATVYIATGMVPNWLETARAGRANSNGPFDTCTNLRSEGERQVIEAMRGAEDMSPSELYKQVDISKGRAKKHRQRLQERGLIEKEGERRWAKYSDNGLESLNIAGSVNLSLSVCSPYNNSIRGSKPIESRPEAIVQSRDLPADPSARYPDWMLSVQHQARERRISENLKQRRRETV